MAIEIIVPRLGWDMEEGGFGGWLKSDGDNVAVGDLLFTLESEKATEDIESLDAGILRIAPDGPKAGDKIAVGAAIGFLVSSGEEAPFQRASSIGTTAVQAMVALSAPSPQPHASQGTPQLSLSASSPTISPRAKRVAGEMGIDWVNLKASGRTGRIRERDVRAAGQSVPAGDLGANPVPAGSPESRPIPTGALRKTIATRMLQSVRSTAPVTLTTTADATNLVNLRNQFKASATPGDAVLPGYTHFLVKLLAIALPKHPLLNARRNGNAVLAQGVHIGIAVDTEAGLLVPVVRDVPSLGLRQLAARTRDLIERARRRALRPEEMQGGTFTVTSLGAFGIDAFTPIINYPECAILGVGRIQRQATVAGDQIVARDTVTLSLTFDHCIVDGAPAARFLQDLVKLVENPGPSLIS
jgi:pyruvate dehydrogenase E2 component (dihydrolipoamide acetyltransferase)